MKNPSPNAVTKICLSSVYWKRYGTFSCDVSKAKERYLKNEVCIKDYTATPLRMKKMMAESVAAAGTVMTHAATIFLTMPRFT